MNTFLYHEIPIGHEEKFDVMITEEDLAAFRRITGDGNKLHCSEEYAQTRGFEGRVVYGMLVASYLSTLAGVYLPGERSIIYEVEVKFVSPLVFSGNTLLTVNGTVIDKNDSFSRLVIKVHIDDESGRKILRGTMKVGVMYE